jgi:hypothetical protein
MAPPTAPANTVIPREFSKTKEKIGQNNKGGTDLKKEVELMEHVSTPIAGIQKLAHEFGFKVPQTIEEHMTNGISQSDADRVLERHHLNELTPAPSTHWLIIFAGHMLGGFSLPSGRAPSSASSRTASVRRTSIISTSAPSSLSSSTLPVASPTTRRPSLPL